MLIERRVSENHDVYLSSCQSSKQTTRNRTLETDSGIWVIFLKSPEICELENGSMQTGGTETPNQVPERLRLKDVCKADH